MNPARVYAEHQHRRRNADGTRSEVEGVKGAVTKEVGPQTERVQTRRHHRMLPHFERSMLSHSAALTSAARRVAPKVTALRSVKLKACVSEGSEPPSGERQRAARDPTQIPKRHQKERTRRARDVDERADQKA